MCRKKHLMEKGAIITIYGKVKKLVAHESEKTLRIEVECFIDETSECRLSLNVPYEEYGFWRDVRCNEGDVAAEVTVNNIKVEIRSDTILWATGDAYTREIIVV